MHSVTFHDESYKRRKGSLEVDDSVVRIKVKKGLMQSAELAVARSSITGVSEPGRGTLRLTDITGRPDLKATPKVLSAIRAELGL